MKLQSIEVRKLLEIERQNAKDDKWIEHCICVGNSAGIIAAKSIKEVFRYISKEVEPIFKKLQDVQKSPFHSQKIYHPILHLAKKQNILHSLLQMKQ